MMRAGTPPIHIQDEHLPSTSERLKQIIALCGFPPFHPGGMKLPNSRCSGSPIIFGRGLRPAFCGSSANRQNIGCNRKTYHVDCHPTKEPNLPGYLCRSHFEPWSIWAWFAQLRLPSSFSQSCPHLYRGAPFCSLSLLADNFTGHHKAAQRGKVASINQPLTSLVWKYAVT